MPQEGARAALRRQRITAERCSGVKGFLGTLGRCSSEGSSQPATGVQGEVSLRGPFSRGENANSVVVQCPNCQSKFRIADEKVTDRGVRVRCTACKNVFQVRKGGEMKPADSAVTGTTQEMQALDPALLGGLAGAARPALARAPAAPQPSAPPPMGSPPTGALPRRVPPQSGSLPPLPRPPGLAPARAPGTLPRPPGLGPSNNGPPPKPRLQADDLFGMAELTGEAAAMPGSPLSSQQSMPPFPRPAPGKPPARPPPGRPPGAAAKPAPLPQRPAPAAPPRPPALSADDFDVDLGGDGAGSRPLTPPEGQRQRQPPRPPPPPPEAARPLLAPPPPPPGVEDTLADPPPDVGPVKLGQFKTQLKDPFEGVDLGSGEQREGASELSADRLGEKPKAERKPPETPPSFSQEPIPQTSARRELVSSALTGLVGAALALVVVLFAAISEGEGASFNPFAHRSELVPTKVVSGLYDTASGKPIFFVRGRVENRSKKVRGPIRVVAELVAENGVEAKAEALAGTEPSPEEVYGLRTPAEVDKLNRLLSRNEAERRVPPGGSLPFFAIIADPPQDLQRHKLHVKLESIDAWVMPSKGAEAPKPAEPALDKPGDKPAVKATDKVADAGVKADKPSDAKPADPKTAPAAKTADPKPAAAPR